MRINHLFATAILCCVTAEIRAADAPAALQPNAVLQLDFPDLAPNLYTMVVGKPHNSRLTAQLPENYSADGRFGLLVYLGGGAGGPPGGDVAGARAIAGSRDFVCVNLPLFKRAIDKTEAYGGLMVAMDDFEVIATSYRIMLQRLFDTVPNIDPARSAIGGFSNGAHTTAVLLAGQDAFILDRFRIFYFVDGGVGPLSANLLQKGSMKRCRLLMLSGDQPPADQFREGYLAMGRGLELGAKKFNLNYTAILMRGYGHAFPPAYAKLIGNWVRGEALPEIPPGEPVAAPVAKPSRSVPVAPPRQP